MTIVRWGQIGSTSNDTNSTTLSILEHVQYYAPIDTYGSLQSKGDYFFKDNQTFYKESCTTSALSMNSLTPMDWKSLSASIQHEIKVSGSSQLAKYYWECSTVHWSDSLSLQPASESRTSRGYNSHDHVITHGHYQGRVAWFRLPFGEMFNHGFFLIVVIVIFFFSFCKKEDDDAKQSKLYH